VPAISTHAAIRAFPAIRAASGAASFATTASTPCRIRTSGRPLGYKPQHVYTVRFAGEELWGERASARDFVYVDLWEDYLEPA